MTARAWRQGALAALARGAGRRVVGWWRIVHLAALLLAMLLSPATYRGEDRRALARHMVVGTVPSLPWFTVLTALIAIVLIRIVIVTALSYGLSQYAVEMVVRVLVLELIPLTAALFAAVRTALPNAAEIAALRAQGDWNPWRGDASQMRREVLPRVAAGVFSALMLAAVSCVVTLVIAYLSIYGFTTAGVAGFTRTVGHVFDAGVTLVFGLKILFFAFAVALVPAASVLDAPRMGPGASAEVQGLVRMLLVLVLIEVAALVGNYY